MKTILITGINGFLGSSLAKALSKEYNVIGLEYTLENLFRLKNTKFKIYSSQDNLNSIFQDKKIDIVIHTATIYRKSNEPIDRLIQTNIILPVKLYELAQQYGAECFVNTDSFFNNSSHSYSYLGEYTLSKRHCLEWLKTIQKETKLINMKIFHMYGPGDSPHKFVSKIIEDLKSNRPIIELTPGEQKRDFIFIDDVVESYKTVINNINTLNDTFIEFEVGIGKAISVKKFVSTAAKLIKSRSDLKFGALSYREGEIMFSEANNMQLRNLGWQPQYSIHEGLKRLYNLF